MNKKDLGFHFAIFLPNPITHLCKVYFDNNEHPLFYKKEEFMQLLKDHGYFNLTPYIYKIFTSTRNFVFDADNERFTPLTIDNSKVAFKELFEIIRQENAQESEEDDFTVTLDSLQNDLNFINS